jgi:hypothetical protein
MAVSEAFKGKLTEYYGLDEFGVVCRKKGEEMIGMLFDVEETLY